jgi:hypothetical protein
MKWRIIGAVVVLILLLLVAIKIVPLFIAKPSSKIDYVAEYSKITKPADYDPEQNAAPYYQKAFSSLSDMPKNLSAYTKRDGWLSDANEAQLGEYKKYVEDNAEALKSLRLAVQKPYYWVEGKSENGHLSGMKLIDLSKLRSSCYLLCLQAKLEAVDGNLSQAYDDIVLSDKMGDHLGGSRTLVEQLVGIAIHGIAYKTAFTLLEKTTPSPDILAKFQHELELRSPEQYQLNFSIGEKLYALDEIQRMFSDDGNGNGILIPANLMERSEEWLNTFTGESKAISYPKALWICLWHADRCQTEKQLQALYVALNILAATPPHEMRQKNTTYEQEIEPLLKNQFLLSDSVPVFVRLLELATKEALHRQAIITTVALIRYNSEHNEFPSSLDELVEGGYLKTLPIDPYSGKALVYRKDKTFVLYSIGQNFKNDGGDEQNDIVFWPSEKASVK